MENLIDINTSHITLNTQVTKSHNHRSNQYLYKRRALLATPACCVQSCSGETRNTYFHQSTQAKYTCTKQETGFLAKPVLVHLLRLDLHQRMQASQLCMNASASLRSRWIFRTQRHVSLATARFQSKLFN
jgi:hypothetical protein